MVKRDPATCPGLFQFMRPKPEYTVCSHCKGQVEIWSDELKAACRYCGTTVTRGMESCLDWCEYTDKRKGIIGARKKERGEP